MQLIHYATSAMKRFLTSVSFLTSSHLSRKRFSHEYRMKFYITRCENADFRTRGVRQTAFYTRNDEKAFSLKKS